MEPSSFRYMDFEWQFYSKGTGDSMLCQSVSSCWKASERSPKNSDIPWKCTAHPQPCCKGNRRSEDINAKRSLPVSAAVESEGSVTWFRLEYTFWGKKRWLLLKFQTQKFSHHIVTTEVQVSRELLRLSPAPKPLQSLHWWPELFFSTLFLNVLSWNPLHSQTFWVFKWPEI